MSVKESCPMKIELKALEKNRWEPVTEKYYNPNKDGEGSQKWLGKTFVKISLRFCTPTAFCCNLKKQKHGCGSCRKNDTKLHMTDLYSRGLGTLLYNCWMYVFISVLIYNISEVNIFYLLSSDLLSFANDWPNSVPDFTEWETLHVISHYLPNSNGISPLTPQASVIISPFSLQICFGSLLITRITFLKHRSKPPSSRPQ